MLYQFRCKNCNHFQEEVFPVAEWDEHMTADSCLRNISCEGCGEAELYRSIEKLPAVRGGTTGYKSMDRYWSENPDLVRRHKEQMEKDNERHKKFKNEAIRRQKAGEQIGPRRKDDQGGK